MGPRRKSKKQLLKEARPIIEAIAERKRRTGAFAYFQGDDIAQEVWCICLRAIEEYDATKGKLEHYLARCVENRLKNLRRDRYFRPPNDNLDKNGETRDRINIVNALPLGGGDIAEGGSALCSSMQRTQPHDVLMAQELREQIEARLPEEVLPDFQRMLDGDRLSAVRRERVRAAVTEALEDIDG